MPSTGSRTFLKKYIRKGTSRCGWASHRCREAAFTLIELLLTVVLLLLLLGAVVFNYSTLARGARMDHGVSQLESLFRFARAQASTSGRQVRIEFRDTDSSGKESDQLPSTSGAVSTVSPPGSESGNPTGSIDDGKAGTVSRISVVWETDPLGDPGHFVSLPEAQPMLDELNEVIRVKEVRFPSSQVPAAQWDWNGFSSVVHSSSSFATNTVMPFDAQTGFKTAASVVSPNSGPNRIAFFPDGSSDSVDLVVAATEADDTRQLLLTLSGLSGRLQQRWLEVDADGRRQDDDSIAETLAVESSSANEPVQP